MALQSAPSVLRSRLQTSAMSGPKAAVLSRASSISLRPRASVPSTPPLGLLCPSRLRNPALRPRSYISRPLHLAIRSSSSQRSEQGAAPSSSFKDFIIPTLPTPPSNALIVQPPAPAPATPPEEKKLSRKAEERIRRVKREKFTYLVAAIVSSVSFTCLAAAAVVYRFASQVQDGGELPYVEIFGTFALAVGAAVGMEFWARWAHKALWHGSLWDMHESHHRPREGPFELNDVFAIINAGPAIGLLAYGFFFPGLIPGLCFGAGLGITMFGMAYMFVHDGLVHRRFPVGPVADVPYLQRVAAAHKLHHADKFEGVPYGLFLGPQELEEVGGLEDLEELLALRRAANAKEVV